MLSRSSVALVLAVVACGDARPVDRPPVLAAPAISVATLEDHAVAIETAASDPEGAPLAYAATTPEHGALTNDGGRFVYTPAADFTGLDAFEIAVSDETSTVYVEVAIAVGATNDGPVAADVEAVTTEDHSIDVTLVAVDVDTAELAYEVLEMPAHGTLTGEPPHVTYTPSPHFFGADSFTYQATDGALTSSVATVTITIADTVTCGDGIAEGPEPCDDANADDTDACLSTCTAATCGDGVVYAGVEECDGAPDCRADCTVPRCGDGITDPGEQCDDTNVADGDGCGHSCRVEACGDHLIQLAAGESCDDGNTSAGDGCDATCHTEPFLTVAPVKVSGDLACTTVVASAAKRIAVDGSGTIYATMKCDTQIVVVVSTDRGQTFSAPRDLSADLPDEPVVAMAAIATGPSRIAYAAIMTTTGLVYLRRTVDAGATWSAAELVGAARSATPGLGLQAFNDDVYLGFSKTAGVQVARNHTGGAGGFAITPVALPSPYFDLGLDPVTGTVVVTGDTPLLQVRASSDRGETFMAARPPGSQYYSDWAIGNGMMFVSGSNLISGGNATLLHLIPVADPTTSTSVAGLPAVTTLQSRTLAADTAGNAFVASQLTINGGVQLDRLASGASAFDAPRSFSATGIAPIVAALPGAAGAAVMYTDGTEVYVTVQAY